MSEADTSSAAHEAGPSLSVEGNDVATGGNSASANSRAGSPAASDPMELQLPPMVQCASPPQSGPRAPDIVSQRHHVSAAGPLAGPVAYSDTVHIGSSSSTGASPHDSLSSAASPRSISEASLPRPSSSSVDASAPPAESADMDTDALLFASAGPCDAVSQDETSVELPGGNAEGSDGVGLAAPYHPASEHRGAAVMTSAELQCASVHAAMVSSQPPSDRAQDLTTTDEQLLHDLRHSQERYLNDYDGAALPLGKGLLYAHEHCSQPESGAETWMCWPRPVLCLLKPATDARAKSLCGDGSKHACCVAHAELDAALERVDPQLASRPVTSPVACQSDELYGGIITPRSQLQQARTPQPCFSDEQLSACVEDAGEALRGQVMHCTQIRDAGAQTDANAQITLQACRILAVVYLTCGAFANLLDVFHRCAHDCPKLLVSVSVSPQAAHPYQHTSSVCAAQACRQRQRVSVTGSELSAAVAPTRSHMSRPAAGRRSPGVPAQTVSVQAAAMLVITAQSPGTSVSSTTVSNGESAVHDGQRACREPDTAARRPGSGEVWPVSASVAAWLAGASEPEGVGQGDAGRSDGSGTIESSTTRQSSPAPAKSLMEALLALRGDQPATSASSCSSPEHNGNAVNQAGSLHAAVVRTDGSAAGLTIASAAPSADGADTPRPHDAPREAAAWADPLPQLRAGPWHVSADAHPAEDVAETTDVQCRADAVPDVVPAATAQQLPTGAAPNVAEASVVPAVQFLLERSAQTAVQIAPHDAVELRTVQDRESLAAAAGSAEQFMQAVASAEGCLPVPSGKSNASAELDKPGPAQVRAAPAMASRTAALPPSVPVRKALLVASTDSRRGSLRALQLRLAVRSTADPARPQSAPTGDREPTLVQPRWSIARPASPSRDPNQASAVSGAATSHTRSAWSSCSYMDGRLKSFDIWTHYMR